MSISDRKTEVMEKTEKKGFLGREYTRREFMKLTAKGLTGVALSSSLLSLMGATSAQAQAGQVGVLATPNYLLVANFAKCTGCQRCEANCTLANNGNAQPFIARLHVRDSANFGLTGPLDDIEDGDGFFGNWSVGPETCKQCADPLCLTNCPVKAIYVDENTGARLVNQNECVGCGLCNRVCPWRMPRISGGKSSKCINCGACVRGCPTSAIRMIDWEDVAKAM